MESTNSNLLPHILEALGAKQELCDTFDNLCQEIGEYLATEYENIKTADIRNALKRALKVGQNLGIVTMVDNIVRMPFKLHRNEENFVRKSNDIHNEGTRLMGDSTSRRRKSLKPKKRNFNDNESSDFYMINPRNGLAISTTYSAPADRIRRSRQSRYQRRRSVSGTGRNIRTRSRSRRTSTMRRRR